MICLPLFGINDKNMKLVLRAISNVCIRKGDVPSSWQHSLKAMYPGRTSKDCQTCPSTTRAGRSSTTPSSGVGQTDTTAAESARLWTRANVNKWNCSNSRLMNRGSVTYTFYVHTGQAMANMVAWYLKYFFLKYFSRIVCVVRSNAPTQYSAKCKLPFFPTT